SGAVLRQPQAVRRLPRVRRAAGRDAGATVPGCGRGCAGACGSAGDAAPARRGEDEVRKLLARRPRGRARRPRADAAPEGIRLAGGVAAGWGLTRIGSGSDSDQTRTRLEPESDQTRTRLGPDSNQSRTRPPAPRPHSSEL